LKFTQIATSLSLRKLQLTAILEEGFMSIPKVIDDVIQFVSGAVSRIFSVSDDKYPNTGVQPFDGDFHKKDHSTDY